MKKLLRRVSAVLLLGSVFVLQGCASAPSASAQAQAQTSAMEVVQRWTKAFTDSDVDAIVRLYAPDAMFMGTGSKTIVTTPAEVRDYFERALLTSRPRGAVFLKSSVMVLSNDAVAVTGLDEVSGTRDGVRTSAKGRVTLVIARRDAGWQIVQFHRSAMPN